MKKIVYVSFDGKQFDDELEYEKYVEVLIKRTIDSYSTNLKILNSFLDEYLSELRNQNAKCEVCEKDKKIVLIFTFTSNDRDIVVCSNKDISFYKLEKLKTFVKQEFENVKSELENFKSELPKKNVKTDFSDIYEWYSSYCENDFYALLNFALSNNKFVSDNLKNELKNALLFGLTDKCLKNEINIKDKNTSSIYSFVNKLDFFRKDIK